MSGQLGMGVMIQMLSGNRESVEAFKAAVGKEIATVEMKRDVLCFDFTDGTTLKLSDNGQSCCESRYMTTDDDLPYYAGAKLLDAEVKDGPSTEGEYGNSHETAFLVI